MFNASETQKEIIREVIRCLWFSLYITLDDQGNAHIFMSDAQPLEQYNLFHHTVHWILRNWPNVSDLVITKSIENICSIKISCKQLWNIQVTNSMC